MIAPQVRQLASDILALETKHARQGEMIDACLDMHSDLINWATNSPDEQASKEVLMIVERHLKKFKNTTNDSVFALAVPKGVAQGNQT